MSNSEEYLDDLLKSLDEEDSDEKNSDEMGKKEEDTTEKETTFSMVDNTSYEETAKEDDFLKEFEKEMSSDNLTDFLKGFEMDLNEEKELDLNIENELIDQDAKILQQFEEMNENQEESSQEFEESKKPEVISEEEIQPEEEKLLEEEIQLEEEKLSEEEIQPEEEKLSEEEIQSEEENFSVDNDFQPDKAESFEDVEASDLPEEADFMRESEEILGEMTDEPIGMTDETSQESEKESSSLDDALNDLMGSDLFGADSSEMKLPDAAVSDEAPSEIDANGAGSDEDDLMALLSDLGEDSDLADIGKMLQADANNEPIEASNTSEQQTQTDELNQLADALEALDMGEIPIKEKEKPIEQKKVNNELQTDDLPPKNFFQKIVGALFGPDEVIDEEAEKAEQEAETLKKAEKKAEKDVQKEEKKKVQSEKKAEQQKIAQEKKDAKAAQALEKKEKKLAKLALEPPDKTPKIPKKLIVLVGIFAISLFALQSVGTNYLGYNMMHNQAQQAYDQGDYLTAYAKMTGETIHASDKPLFEKAKVLANLQQEYDAYQSLYANKKYQLALDSLIKGQGRYTIYSNQATQLGVSDAYNKIQAEIVQALNDQFNLSADQALAIYNTQTREQYTTQLNGVLSKMGLQ